MLANFGAVIDKKYQHKMLAIVLANHDGFSKTLRIHKRSRNINLQVT